MQNYEQSITKKFKWLVVFYDMFEIPFLLNKHMSPRRALTRKIPNEPLRILDVCVGSANSALPIARTNDANEIIGVDLSPDMLAAGERKIQRRGIRNIHLQQMDAAKMTFQDGEFDIVMVSFGLHELKPDLMLDVLKEMSRVLKVSGALYIVDYERQSTRLKSFVLSVFLKLLEPNHIQQFLEYDWGEILQSVGIRIIETEKCLFTKLISAVKQPDMEHVENHQ